MSQNPAQASLFGPSSGAEKPKFDLIPAGTLSFGVVSMSDKGIGTSSATGGEYANLVITLYGNKDVEKRKIYHLLPNPLDKLNSDAWRQMGISALTRILEANGFFNFADPESYKKLSYEGVTFEDMLEQILGTDCAVEVGIEKGTDGRDDKNSIKNWLTPSTDKASARGKGLWDLLIAGVTTSVKARAPGSPHAPGAAASGAKKLGPAALAAQALRSGAGPAGVQAPSAGLRSPQAAASGLRRPGMFGGDAIKAPEPVVESTPTGDVVSETNPQVAG